MNTTAPKNAQPISGPPDDVFWEKYSPHFEFPLSGVGSIAAHVAAIALFALLLYFLRGITFSDKTPVPIRVMAVSPDDGGGEDGAAGSGGGTPKENTDPFTKPLDPVRPIPEKTLEAVKEEVKDWVPKIPQGEDAPKVEDLNAVKKIAQLNEDLKKSFLPGKGEQKGMGTEPGMGNTGQEGKGPGGAGDATSSKNRAIRWELLFKTESGPDYIRQLAAMNATLMIPDPDGKTNKIYKNIGAGKPVGQAFELDQLPGLFFIDESPDSAAKVAQTLGLGHTPTQFAAFFPKEIEEELAVKEKAYRNRKESDIFSTKFKILVRDGKFTITVVDQIPVKR